MAKRQLHPSPTTTDLVVDYLKRSDKEVMHALVAAGAMVALADGQLEAIEREELVNFVDRHGFVPTASRRHIAETFDQRARELTAPLSVNDVVETFRPLAGRSLASVVVRTAERVAAADRKFHAGELRALKLIRLVLATLPTRRPLPALHGA